MRSTTETPRAGRREWIGLAVLALACLLYAMDAAKDTLGAAVAVAAQLSSELGQAVLDGAREAFVHGFQLAAGTSAIVALVLALVAARLLRDARLCGEGTDTEETKETNGQVEQALLAVDGSC